MRSETRLGESSDGQFTYMTGMLPLKEKVTIYEVVNNTLITFPRLMKEADSAYYTKMVIPTGEQAWSQNKMCEKYDIDTLFSRDDYCGTADDCLNDEQLFRLACKTDEITREPFVSVILTVSTHSPWNKVYEDFPVCFPETFSNELKTYLKNVHYVDKWLGWYLQSLKDKGLYSSSTIVIMADHKPNVAKLNLGDCPSLCDDIPLLIINSPVKFSNDCEKEIFQTSFFPTLLDMWGIESSWRGVGESLLQTDSISGQDMERERMARRQEMSEALIYSDYFAE